MARADSLTLDDCFVGVMPIPATRKSKDDAAAPVTTRAKRITGSATAAMDSRADPKTAAATLRDDACVVALVASGKDGDVGAMELLIERYQSRVAGFVFACVGEAEAVDDLSQTIFYRMLRGLSRLEADASFEPWLFRIARNVCFDHLRRRKLRRVFVPWQSAAGQIANAAQSPANDIEDRVERFRRALMRLPRRQRELIALLQDRRLSYEQLGVITGSSVSSVKSLLFRARRELRRRMHDDC